MHYLVLLRFVINELVAAIFAKWATTDRLKSNGQECNPENAEKKVIRLFQARDRSIKAYKWLFLTYAFVSLSLDIIFVFTKRDGIIYGKKAGEDKTYIDR